MKQFKIISFASAVFVICVIIAYHNTASLGYDKHDIIYYDSQGVDVMDYRIEYNDIIYSIKKITDLVPDSFMTI